MRQALLYHNLILFFYLSFAFCHSLLSQGAINRLPLEYVEKALAQEPILENFSYPGVVLYPEYFEIQLHRVPSPQLPEEKQYLGNVIVALFLDYLSLIRESTIENPQPLAIVYPYPPEKEEDRRNSFLLAKPSPKVFPLKVREVASQLTLNEVLKGRAQLAKQAFHLLYHLELAAGSFVLRVGFFWENRLLHEQRETFRETETSEKVMLIASAIRRKLAPPETGNLSLKSSPERVSVYLDEVFLGKTPLLLDSIAPASYNLTLRKEGFQDFTTSLEVVAGQTREYTFTLKPLQGIGTIEIITEPPQARIYQGVVFSGFTPLKLEGLPLGTIRLHVSKEGYVDEFRNFTISPEEPHHLWRLKLREGSAKDFYRPQAAVFGPLSWYDFFVASVILAGGFSGSAIYFSVARDNVRDKMLASLSTNNPALFTEADQKLYREKTAEINRYGTYATLSLSAAGLSLGFAFYSFYRHILSTEAQFAHKNLTQTDSLLAWQASLQADGYTIAMRYHF